MADKYQEALDKIKNMGDKDLYNEFHLEWAKTLQELVDKHEQLEQENFDLRQKLNTEEECCVMLKKKVKKQVEIIISLCKALQENGVELSYLSYFIFSYLTQEEWLYCKELLDYE